MHQCIRKYYVQKCSIENELSTFLLVHSLKYGMLASKGHAIAVPSKISIAKKLPLLPEEVKLLILKRNNTSSKKYTASRFAVQ